jgi:hypothetical protein
MNDSVELDWNKAKGNFDSVRKIYMDMEHTPGVNTTLALRLGCWRPRRTLAT